MKIIFKLREQELMMKLTKYVKNFSSAVQFHQVQQSINQVIIIFPSMKLLALDNNKLCYPKFSLDYHCMKQALHQILTSIQPRTSSLDLI